MNIAIMQPYLFPYLGYFQLIRAVDTFVIYDDVNYIKGGWINRNYILSQDDKKLITLPLKGASPNLLINQINVCGRPEKLLATLRHCYRQGPQFNKVFPLVESILLHQENNLACLLERGLRLICDYLGLCPAWHISSALEKDNTLRGQHKLLAICVELGATQYINLQGGKALYNADAFARHGLQLSFIEPRAVDYPQFKHAFVPNLSILDVMMFNDREQCARLLMEYDLA